MVEENKGKWFEGIEEWDDCILSSDHGVDQEWHITAPEVLNGSIADKLEAQLKQQRIKGNANSMFSALRTYNLHVERNRLERMDTDPENLDWRSENVNIDEEESLIIPQAERSDMVVRSEKCCLFNAIESAILSFCCCKCRDSALRFRRYGRYILLPNIERQFTETFER